jgi:hypothetical protein
VASGAARRRLPWAGLLVASSTAAYALEVVAASPRTLGTPAPVPHATTASVRERAPSEGPHQLLLTITLRDPTTGRDMPRQCATTSERAPTEELVVDAHALADVAAVLCEPRW